MRDLVGIEKEMIDSKNKQLYLPDGRVFDLTDRLYQLLMNALNETEYVWQHGAERIFREFKDDHQPLMEKPKLLKKKMFK